MNLNQRQLQHLYVRAGFGMPYPYVMDRVGKSADALVDELFEQSRRVEDLDELPLDRFTYARQSDLPDNYQKTASEDARIYRDILRNAWLRQMVDSSAPLREKMTFFWHDHFASDDLNPLLMQIQNNMFRKNALGTFSDLLHRITKDPCMLRYLDNNRNRKDAPNENFARELLELFTVGRGNYTEQDVKSAAKAFTGWTFNSNLKFEIQQSQHDNSTKTFMGKTGNFDGKDIINILLDNKKTAYNITLKMYKYFVNAEEVDNSLVNSLTDSFYNSGYDITKLLKNMLTSSWFYADKVIGQQIKSPILFLVSMHRTFFMEMPDDDTLIDIQKRMEQILLAPPNVAGWPEGRTWIDSSSLTYRSSLSNLLFGGDGISWSKFAHRFRDVPRQELPEAIAGFLFQTPINVNLVQGDLNFNTGRSALVKDIMLKLTQFPEFQLC